MTNPQTWAKEIGKNCAQIGATACLAFTVLWCMKKDKMSDAEAIATVSKAIDAEVLGKDCTVLWKKYLKWLTGEDYEVEFKPITTIKDFKERTPVLYKNGDSEHWVGVEKGKVCFNSYANSKTLKLGVPVEARIIRKCK